MSATKIEENEPGRYYVTNECNGCGLCFAYALQNFMYAGDSSYYYIIQQPVDYREVDDILKAISVCPMDCIKSDGELVNPA